MASWTDEENHRFEYALNTYDERTPDRWQQVARAVGGGKSAEEVKRHFKMLKRDVRPKKVNEVLRHYDQLDNNHAGGSSTTNANGRSSRGGGGGSSREPRQPR